VSDTYNSNKKKTHRMFARRLQDLMRWIDTDALKIDNPVDLRDSFRVRVLELTRDFIAFPLCENFSLMPQEEEEGGGGGTQP
jgi:hypothetical protein